MAEIRKASLHQTKGYKGRGNLDEVAKGYLAQARMYENISSTITQVSNKATSTLIGMQVRASAKEGETKGESGELTEPKSEWTAWGRAYNDALKKGYESNIANRASSFTKVIAETSDGDTDGYMKASNEAKANALKNAKTEPQRKYIENTYDKYTLKNGASVEKTRIKHQRTRTKQSWDDGNSIFEEDYGVVLDTQSQLMQTQADDTRNGASANHTKQQQKEIDALDDSINGLVKDRRASAQNGINMGVLNDNGVNTDIASGVLKAKVLSYTDLYRNAPTPEQKGVIRDYIEYQSTLKVVDEDGQVNHTALTLKGKDTILTALDNEESREQKAWSTKRKRGDAEYAISKKSSINDINVLMLDDANDVEAVQKVETALRSGYISHDEYIEYKDEIENGSEVKRDSWNSYTAITNNPEDYDVNTIAGINNLTRPTKKALIAKRVAWEEKGEEWMSGSAYSGGKNLIAKVYNFPEKGIMPEFLTKNSQDKYTEMLYLQEEYRSLVKTAKAKGDFNSGIDIAQMLLNKQEKSITSKIHNKFKDVHQVTYENIKSDQAVTFSTFNESMKAQLERDPKSYYNARTGGAPKPVKTEKGKKEVAPLTQDEKERLEAIFAEEANVNITVK